MIKVKEQLEKENEEKEQAIKELQLEFSKFKELVFRKKIVRLITFLQGYGWSISSYEQPPAIKISPRNEKWKIGKWLKSNCDSEYFWKNLRYQMYLYRFPSTIVFSDFSCTITWFMSLESGMRKIENSQFNENGFQQKTRNSIGRI